MPENNIITRSINRGDNAPLRFGTVAKLLWETADANANELILVFPEGGAVDVPVFVIGDASIDNVDLGFFNGVTEPTIAVINDAADAYVSLDAGDDAVAASKGLYFKAAADEDIELINLSVTGTPRVYWDESEDQFRSTKGWVFDAACDVQGTWVATAAWTIPAVTLGGTVTVSAQTLDAGAGKVIVLTSASLDGFQLESSSGTHGPQLLIYANSTTPAIDDILGRITWQGRDSAANVQEYGYIDHKITSPTSTTEESRLEIILTVGGAQNSALTLSGGGTLGVDLSGVSGTYANVDLFDEYDDALVLKQGIQQNNRELLADMGILDRKDTGSGYMLKIQPMIRLLAGGIYQSRFLIDDLQEKVKELEHKILMLNGG